jgi:hypothetical protein
VRSTRGLRRGGAAFLASAAALLVAAGGAQAAPWPEQYWFNRLSIDQAWTLSRGAGVTVAVIDTGVVDTVPSLVGQVLPGIDLTGAGGDGRSDAGQSAAPGFTYSHGTNMAALIAGRADVPGLVGIAPDAKILPIKVFARTGRTEENSGAVAKGIRYAVDSGAQIINLSLAAPAACPADEADAVAYAYARGVIVVAGTGNVAGPVQSPANCPGALAVTASDVNFVPWADNATGPEVAFTSVGVDTPELTLEGGKLTGASGTSAAAATTSGVFALLRSAYPSESARQIVARAILTAKNGLGRPGRIGDQQGYGQPLPLQGMQAAPGANASNPIYDAFDKELKTTTSAPSSPVPSGTGSSPAPSPSSGGTVPFGGAGHSTDGSGSALVPIAAIGAGVAVLAVIIIFVIRSRRRAAGPTGPPQWGP